MKEHGMETFVVHAPYIINLANTTKPETFELAVEFLEVEVERTKAMGSHTLVLHQVLMLELVLTKELIVSSKD